MCVSECERVCVCVNVCGDEESPTWSAYMGKMFSAASSYLPAQVSGMMCQDRAFATVRLQMAGQRNVCTLATSVPTSATPTASGPLNLSPGDPDP